MADEQGLNVSNGWFARSVLGKYVNNLLTNVGTAGRGFTQLDAPPSNPEVGDLYLTDGSNWDPNAAGSPELVVYDTGGTWTSVAVL